MWLVLSTPAASSRWLWSDTYASLVFIVVFGDAYIYRLRMMTFREKSQICCAFIEVAGRRTDREPPLRFLIPNRRGILQQRFKAWILAQRIPVRRVSKFARVNSARYFKQVRKSVNRCIDFTQLRQSFCAKSFGDWLE